MRVKSGDRVQIADTKTGESAQVIVGASAGWAELRDVATPDGRIGMVAFKPNGDWWWVARLHAPSDPLSLEGSWSPEQED